MNYYRKLTIGLVLPNVPGYSETFFLSKIQGLEKAGHKVILFVGHNSLKNRKYAIKAAWPLHRILIFQLISMAVLFTGLTLRRPKIVFNFIRLERKTLGWKATLENLYINGHILSERLDWLHFGFATMAVKRESVAKAMGAKMAVSIRGYDVSIYPLKIPNCYQNLWDKVDKIHTISDDLVKKAKDAGMNNSVPVVKITPAIDVTRFHPFLFLNRSDTLKILTVGRLNWKKGLEYALDAMKILKDEGLDFEYGLVGEGPEYERLLFACHQLGIKNHVKFLGKKSASEIAALMQEYLVYLQPSVQEGFCNAVLEAQSSGMLCVVTNAEGLSENVLHGETGWVVKRRNPKEITEAIKKLNDLSEVKKETIRKNAVQRIKSEFNLDQYNKKFIDFYK